MLNPQEIFILRKENTQLKTQNTKLKHSLLLRQDKLDRLEQENKQLKEEKIKLEKELEKMKKQRDKYKGMIFKPNIFKSSSKISSSSQEKSLGGQIGHIGASRKLPHKVDHIKRVLFHQCPNCGNPLERTDSIDVHTVEDIPSLEEVKTEVIKFECERQWCGKCKKEVVATPSGVIPYSRLGINLIIQVLIWKYVCRMSFEIIVSTLFDTYGMSITVGGLIQILKRTKKWLGKDYGELLTIIRGSPVKHADETSWRIKGLNSWLWAFLTSTEVYYTIEETRGGGVAKAVLEDSRETDVLIRDDYVGYKNLKMSHQSCWAHLLRVSHEAVEQSNCSQEMRELHNRLKIIFRALEEVILKPFNLSERRIIYQDFSKKIQDIIDTQYTAEDVKAVQTRISNQGTNLITALIYPNVPLTNNLAERQIRPAVITRKISGGSRSDKGAETFTVNFSVIQTIKMRNQPLIPTLHSLLLKGALGNTN